MKYSLVLLLENWHDDDGDDDALFDFDDVHKLDLKDTHKNI